MKELGPAPAGYEHGWTAAPILAALAVGVAGLAAFVAWEQRSARPMIVRLTIYFLRLGRAPGRTGVQQELVRRVPRCR